MDSITDVFYLKKLSRIPVIIYLLEPFFPSVPLIYPLKTSRNLWFFWHFQGEYKRNIGLKWVKLLIIIHTWNGLLAERTVTKAGHHLSPSAFVLDHNGESTLSTLWNNVKFPMVDPYIWYQKEKHWPWVAWWDPDIMMAVWPNLRGDDVSM